MVYHSRGTCWPFAGQGKIPNPSSNFWSVLFFPRGYLYVPLHRICCNIYTVVPVAIPEVVPREAPTGSSRLVVKGFPSHLLGHQVCTWCVLFCVLCFRVRMCCVLYNNIIIHMYECACVYVRIVCTYVLLGLIAAVHHKLSITMTTENLRMMCGKCIGRQRVSMETANFLVQEISLAQQ